jgi:beta-galactosidase
MSNRPRAPVMGDVARRVAFVTIELVDARGTVHPFADRLVTVGVAGAGALQGLGSAEPSTEEGFLSPSHRSYRGRALAAIRSTSAGTTTVTVEAEGCDPAVVTITAVASDDG